MIIRIFYIQFEYTIFQIILNVNIVYSLIPKPRKYNLVLLVFLLYSNFYFDNTRGNLYNCDQIHCCYIETWISMKRKRKPMKFVLKLLLANILHIIYLFLSNFITNNFQHLVLNVVVSTVIVATFNFGKTKQQM